MPSYSIFGWASRIKTSGIFDKYYIHPRRTFTTIVIYLYANPWQPIGYHCALTSTNQNYLRESNPDRSFVLKHRVRSENIYRSIFETKTYVTFRCTRKKQRN